MSVNPVRGTRTEGSERDVVYGGHGNDTVYGGGGGDRLAGGSENDTIAAGDGNDWAAGNKGDDVVSGGYGNDTLYGGWGADRLYGGPGDDVLHALARDGQPDNLACGVGNDTAFVLRSERATTTIRGCEKVFIEISPPADQRVRRTQPPMSRRTASQACSSGRRT